MGGIYRSSGSCVRGGVRWCGWEGGRYLREGGLGSRRARRTGFGWWAGAGFPGVVGSAAGRRLRLGARRVLGTGCLLAAASVFRGVGSVRSVVGGGGFGGVCVRYNPMASLLFFPPYRGGCGAPGSDSREPILSEGIASPAGAELLSPVGRMGSGRRIARGYRGLLAG